LIALPLSPVFDADAKDEELGGAAGGRGSGSLDAALPLLLREAEEAAGETAEAAAGGGKWGAKSVAAVLSFAGRSRSRGGLALLEEAVVRGAADVFDAAAGNVACAAVGAFVDAALLLREPSLASSSGSVTSPLISNSSSSSAASAARTSCSFSTHRRTHILLAQHLRPQYVHSPPACRRASGRICRERGARRYVGSLSARAA
jgi:hypothetical protein